MSPSAVRGLDEPLQVFRRAVGGVGREGQHAVVAPVAPAGKVGHRHQLDRGDAERREIGQARSRGGERSFGRERAHVQLVDHGLVPRPPAPSVVAPVVRLRVDDGAAAVHVVGVGSGGRVGRREAVGEAEPVAQGVPGGEGSGEGAAVEHTPMPPSLHRLHRELAHPRQLQHHGPSAPAPTSANRTAPSACTAAPNGISCIRFMTPPGASAAPANAHARGTRRPHRTTVACASPSSLNVSSTGLQASPGIAGIVNSRSPSSALKSMRKSSSCIGWPSRPTSLRPGAGQVGAQAARVRAAPFVVGHLLAVGLEPLHVLHARAVERPALEEIAPAERRVIAGAAR